ncbi:GAF and HD-GYP domain-containing protein [Desulforamulus ruminis]|uniref:Metal-dependent phosphohydrolase HD sub domain protein n=1 Tax=Desulforamulus ruminis (strain ATCC 23193 / DSM 2154 / NCIMB 8452 / DL) TaxID=696281 RepID=F6DPH9_DESRL|nr:HD domain-containing phosphohydrolase [Desulforamulus ruminis]AEG58652.1 metal-dependent phosphohydrolase HD sub domain protein [Desulforamulus ruminis DSM 2154]
MEEQGILLKNQTGFTTDEIETLIEAGGLLSSRLRLEEIVEVLMEQAIFLVKAEVGVLWLNIWENRGISPVAAYSLDFESVDFLQQQFKILMDEILLRGTPQIISRDREEGSHYLLKDTSRALNMAVNSMVFIPLVGKGRCLGCLQLVNKQDGSPFNARDLRLCSAFSGQAAVIIDNSILFANQEKLVLSLIRALSSALDARDPYTRGHSERVSKLAMEIARGLGLDYQQQVVLERAALLHDVGKIGIRDNVLLEAGPLSEEKWNIMKSHPEIGAQIIEQIEPKSLMDEVCEGVMHHQEKFDGTGYPLGLSGENIPLVARIITIADAFDAMTSDRPYRKGKSPREALKEIERCAGSHFDPFLVEVFLKVMRERD